MMNMVAVCHAKGSQRVPTSVVDRLWWAWGDAAGWVSKSCFLTTTGVFLHGLYNKREAAHTLHYALNFVSTLDLKGTKGTDLL